MARTILATVVLLLATLLCAQSITVTSPNGGENWRMNTTHAITWTAPGVSSGTFKITLWRAGANLGVIATGLPASQRSVNWKVGSLAAGTAPAGSGYTVKIKLQDQPIADDSNGPFTINPPLHAGPVGAVQTHPEITAAQHPPFQIHRSPRLEIRELSYNYRNKRFEAWVRNTGNAPFVGHFRWQWLTLCGSRYANKDIPPSQSALLESPQGMHFQFDCDPPAQECSMNAIFSIEPVTQEGTVLASSQVERDIPRYEHTQFLLSERRVMLRFLHGSTYINANQGYTITSDDAFDGDPANHTATFRVVMGIRNCGADAGKFDQKTGMSLYWSVHHWPSNTYTLQPNRFIPAGSITSPIPPGQGISISRVLTLPIRSGRYELRFHLGSNWQAGQVCSVYIRFADDLVH